MPNYLKLVVLISSLLVGVSASAWQCGYVYESMDEIVNATILVTKVNGVDALVIQDKAGRQETVAFVLESEKRNRLGETIVTASMSLDEYEKYEAVVRVPKILPGKGSIQFSEVDLSTGKRESTEVESINCSR